MEEAVTLKLIAKKELTRVIVDSTVQEKAVAHPTDSKLLETARSKAVELAKTPLSQILFDSHVLSLSRPVHTPGTDREAAVERLFTDVVAMVPSNLKKVREFESIDTTESTRNL